MQEKLLELMIKLLKERTLTLTYSDGIMDMYNETLKIIKERDERTN